MSAKFSVNLTNIYTVIIQLQAVKLWYVVWPCTTHLQQRKRRGVIDVILLWRHCLLVSNSRMKWTIFCLVVVVFGEYDPLNVVSHLSDPKKAHACMIPSVMSHRASKSIHGSLQWASPGKIEIKKIVLYFTYLAIRSYTADSLEFLVTCSTRGHNQQCKVLS